jgi:hypothetical protein
MPIQTVQHWEEKARSAERMADEMSDNDARQAMLEVASLYWRLAEQTAKLAEFTGRSGPGRA